MNEMPAYLKVLIGIAAVILIFSIINAVTGEYKLKKHSVKCYAEIEAAAVPGALWSEAEKILTQKEVRIICTDPDEKAVKTHYYQCCWRDLAGLYPAPDLPQDRMGYPRWAVIEVSPEGKVVAVRPGGMSKP